MIVSRNVSYRKDKVPKRKSPAIKMTIKLLSIMFILGTLIFLLYAGRILVIDEKAEKVDVIIVLSGGMGRVEKALELYEAGYAPKLILSNGLVADFYHKALEFLPSESLLLEDKAVSTFDSAVYVKEIMEEHQFTSAIIVSSDYHMRRTKYIFSRVYKESEIKLIYKSIDTSYDSARWWVSKRNIGITISEYIKIVGNTFGVHGIEAKRKLYQFVERFFEW